MYEYKTLKQLTKQNTLMANGIFTVERDKEHFIQYNDYFEHATFFQCPKCKSLNVERETTYGADRPVMIVRTCQDCGYSKTTNFFKEDE